MSTFTNVVPLIAKADLLSAEGSTNLKIKILNQLQKSTRPFLFGKSHEEILDILTPINLEEKEQEKSESSPEHQVPATHDSPSTVPPFSISSLADADNLEMDASLLMSSTYSPPLLPSELTVLLNNLFEPENMLWLRHTATCKFLSWRDRQLATALTELSDSSTELDPLHRERLRRLSAEAGALVHRGSDATVRGSGLGARWAASHIYRDATILDGLPQADRARWLLQRVNEEVAKGSIGVVVPASANIQQSVFPALPGRASSDENVHSSSAIAKVGSSKTSRKHTHYRMDNGELPAWARKGRKRHMKMREIDPTDPLGLVKVWEGWGKVVAWSVGSGVVVGAVWVVVVRGWVGEWTNSAKWW